jgi:phosphohistidine swiveling domain-containing protein
MTKHQQIVNAVVTAMQGITGMAARVHIAKDPATVVPTDMPCIIVKDGRVETIRETLDGGMRNKMLIEISYFSELPVRQ